MPKETRKCAMCSNTFEASLKQNKRTCGPRCSRELSLARNNEFRRQARERIRQQVRFVRICSECNAEFSVNKNSNKLTCSTRCSNLRKQRYWRPHQSMNTATCLDCKREFQRRKPRQKRCVVCDQRRAIASGSKLHPELESDLAATLADRVETLRRRVMQTEEIHGETNFAAEIESYLQRGGKVSVIPPEPDRAMPSVINSFRGGFQNYGQACTPGYNLPLHMGSPVFDAFERIGETEPDPVV